MGRAGLLPLVLVGTLTSLLVPLSLASELSAEPPRIIARPTCTTAPKGVCGNCKNGGCRLLRKFPCTSAQACCEACIALGGEEPCTFWTLNNKLCHLKDREPQPAQRQPTCVSGFVRDRPPTPPPPAPPKGAPNVIHVVVDDLRNSPGFTNHRAGIVTPNLDQLAGDSMVFDRAYVQQGVCSPSRNSFLSGRRPDTTKVWNFQTSFRQTLGYNVTSLPQAFKKAGYLVTGVGKYYHPDHPVADDEPYSWSPELPYFHPAGFLNVKDCAGAKGGVQGQSWASCKMPDSRFQDGMITDAAVGYLHSLANGSLGKRPFFLAVGLHKPHTPWVVPRRFLDKQTPDADCDVAQHPKFPSGSPSVAFYHCGNLDSANGTIDPAHPLPTAQQQTFRRAYRAAMTFTDHNIGRLMNATKELGVDNNTIVVFNGDHGWLLGEHGGWCKQSNFDLVARIPLMVKVPGVTNGTRTAGLVEAVDIFPTLLDLAGIDIDDRAELEGHSFAPLIHNPAAEWKNASFSQYPRCSDKSGKFDATNPCTKVQSQDFYAMGYSIRTDSFRYTRWMSWNGTAPEWNSLLGEELYDHTEDTGFDTDAAENTNLADNPQYAATKQRHVDALALGWRAALPPPQAA